MRREYQSILPVLCVSSLFFANAAMGQEWTGPYVGIGLGADVISGAVGVNDSGGDRAKAEGVGGGDLGLSFRAGYDYQLNRNFVAGLMGIYDWSNIETRARITTENEHASANLLKLDNSWTIAGRIGFLATPDLMLYALAGYSRVEFGDITADGPSVSVHVKSKSYDSLVLGGGVEYRLNDSWSLMAEYRRADLDQRTVYSFTHNNGNIDNVWTDPVMHWARFGANYRLNGPVQTFSEFGDRRDWSGFYGGAGIGLDAATRDLKVSDACSQNRCLTGELEGLGGGGLGATITAGFDIRLSHFVLGAFAEYDWSDQKISASASLGGKTAKADLLGLDKSWTFGGRFGYLVTEDVLVYGLLGYSHVDFNDAKISAGNEGVTLGMPSFSGIAAGGGFEKLLSDNLSLRLEYRYVDLGTETLYQDGGLTGTKITMDPSLHMVRAGMSYRLPVGN